MVVRDFDSCRAGVSPLEADAVLVIDESRSIEYASALKRLREIPGVILAFFIETDKLKFKQNLLLIA